MVIDPGHQLGNHNFPRKINRLVPAGGFKKPCNTTGTATDANDRVLYDTNGGQLYYDADGNGAGARVLFAILDGALEFSILSGDGRKLALDIMGPGAVFGEIAFFDPGPRTATVTAIRATRVCRLRHADLLIALGDNPDLGADLLRLAGQRMRWMGQQLTEQVFLPLPGRLARKLLHLAAEDAGDEPIPLSQAELAEFVGATREAVSKTLAGWKRAGVIGAGRGGVTILDRAALAALADPDRF